MTLRPCPECKGARLRPESLAVTVGGLGIHEFTRMSARGARSSGSRQLELSDTERAIARLILREIDERLRFLDNVGVGYLSLERAAATLSGGEAQRIRLATQIGSSLVGVLYILDEPSIGLHQRDNERLIAHAGAAARPRQHRDRGRARRGHDARRRPPRRPGPGRGRARRPRGRRGHRRRGDARSRSRSPASSSRGTRDDRRSRTSAASRRATSRSRARRSTTCKKVDVKVPLGRVLLRHRRVGLGQVHARQRGALQGGGQPAAPGEACGRARTGASAGSTQVDKIINIDQSPIGRTPRSNPATYIGLFDQIRDLFSQDAGGAGARLQAGPLLVQRQGRALRGLPRRRPDQDRDALPAGRLRAVRAVPRQALQPRDARRPLQGQDDRRRARHAGRGGGRLLRAHPEDQAARCRRCTTWGSTTSGSGQPATTLSGGEAQRVKLATELCKVATGRTLYILDEPTTGLHFADIQRLLEVLQRLVDQGNTVVVIEHNLDVIKTADRIIDLGPEGGEEGGELVATGTPEQVAAVEGSYTGRFLRRHRGAPRAGPAGATAPEGRGRGVNDPDTAADWLLSTRGRLARIPVGTHAHPARARRAARRDHRRSCC